MGDYEGPFLSIKELLIIVMLFLALWFMAEKLPSSLAEQGSEIVEVNLSDTRSIEKIVSNLNAKQTSQVFTAANHANIALNNMMGRSGSQIKPDKPLLDQIYLMRMGDYYLLFTSMQHLSKTDLYPYAMSFYNSDSATIRDYSAFAKTIMTSVMVD